MYNSLRITNSDVWFWYQDLWRSPSLAWRMGSTSEIESTYHWPSGITWARCLQLIIVIVPAVMHVGLNRLLGQKTKLRWVLRSCVFILPRVMVWLAVERLWLAVEELWRTVLWSLFINTSTFGLMTYNLCSQCIALWWSLGDEVVYST